MIRVDEGIINEDRIIMAYPRPRGGTALVLDGIKDPLSLECDFAVFESILQEANLLTVGMESDAFHLTEDEIATLRQLRDKGYQYIARDGDGKIFAYRAEPSKGGFGWRVLVSGMEGAQRILVGFDFLKWDDAHPLCITATLQAQENI